MRAGRLATGAAGVKWRGLTYAGWGEQLLRRTLGCSGEEEGETSICTRIAATPHEACAAVGADPADAPAVVDALRDQINREVVTEHRTLMSYCLAYRTDKPTVDKPRWWDPNTDEEPYFFAVLWFLCLIAYGEYQDPDAGSAKSFEARLSRALPGRSVGLTEELNQVWEDLARWSRRQADRYPDEWRALELPRPCQFRRVIGRPHFLAFPHVFDRDKLGRLLQDLGVTGLEPPLRPVLSALMATQKQFSSEFQKDLNDLVNSHLGGGKDPTDSPFWRAVRQEALRPSFSADGRSARRGARLGVLAEWDDDGLVTPFLAAPAGVPAEGLGDRTQLEFPVGDLAEKLWCDVDALLQELSAPRSRVRPADARAFRDGLIPLFDVASGVFRVGVGQEIAACTAALVREDLMPAFRRDFGHARGTSDSGLAGWVLAEGTRLRQSDDLGPEFRNAHSLMSTTEPAPPAVVGGVRSAGSNFYSYKGFLPRIRVVGAGSVAAEWGATQMPCRQDTGDLPMWDLPPELGTLNRSVSVTVRARSEVLLMERLIGRQSTTSLQLYPWALPGVCKGVPSGNFQLETCSRSPAALAGPAAEVGLGFTGDDPDSALDVLPFDRTARWLGPRVGEMSVEPRNGFPWMVTGPKNSPRRLILVEPAEAAPPPGPGTSADGGDRRHWKAAFDAPTKVVRSGSSYLPRPEWGAQAEAIFEAYGRLVRGRPNPADNVGVDAVPITQLATHFAEEPWGQEWNTTRYAGLIDVLAQLSANRSGLPLTEVNAIVSTALELSERHELREQLLRSLAESGAIDILRAADGRQRIVIGRRPRLVAYRDGSGWRASLFGLAGNVLRSEFEAAVRRSPGALLERQNGPNGFLPGVLRVSLGSRDGLVEMAKALDLGPTEYLNWSCGSGRVPAAFAISGELSADPPPEAYAADAWWSWSDRRFVRVASDQGGVVLERRRHALRTPIFVICRDEVPHAWTYSRTWALLSAYEVAGVPVLREEQRGFYVIPGQAPVHLPLPLARLCTLVGVGVPGPRVAPDGRVDGYIYPIGAQLRRVVHPLLPPGWLAPAPP